jgi:hypothetical protein
MLVINTIDKNKNFFFIFLIFFLYYFVIILVFRCFRLRCPQIAANAQRLREVAAHTHFPTSNGGENTQIFIPRGNAAIAPNPSWLKV